MCVNYVPVQRQLLRDVFGVEPPADEWRAETWKDYAAPIIVANGDGRRDSRLGTFGMVPRWRINEGIKVFDTMNARLETVGQKRSFSGAWNKGHFCLIPATAVYEPNYEAGPKSVRYKIWLRDAPVFGIAGLWRDWPDGTHSFTMLTVNADQHSVMNRMHKPGSEKRGVVMLPSEEWDDWLTCRDPEKARTFLRLLPEDAMMTEPAPMPPRKAKAESPMDSL
ncbi:SOS response-associated peptidase [Cupriavidus taiwanensis]|uniref:Abasic site processing protein n=1 Tax=Cupriavidus taiwanensis TaxID=164546 RepID=A0A7Z7NQ97_9BURK|nr:SOS response-associated peptidase family protein [Cupriavidus taiwanensis]SOZ17424.1 conserved hypothetical protein [Cupriavidus taiwanensis]SOZ96320.1 conserved hypothetical protein [Cupriavidus taiwanensis]SPC25727.1 conserved hypothetical protein [Cupriavidus taiwanensis]